MTAQPVPWYTLPAGLAISAKIELKTTFYIHLRIYNE